MKRALTVFIAGLLAVSMAVGTFAAQLGSRNFATQVSGNSSYVAKTVNTKTTSHTVVGYSYRTQAKRVFDYINNEREAAGVAPLTWEEDMYEPAIQRALEQYVLESHTRPNGSECYSVHKLVNGENVAGGDIDAYDVMYGAYPGEGWMNSPGHRENILEPIFDSVAVACVETDKMVYWVQLFHSDTKITREEAEKLNADTSSSSSSAKALTAKTVTSKLASSGKATIKNAETVSPAVLKEIAAWGTKNGVDATFSVNTTVSGKSTVQGRITLNPADFASRTENLALGVYTASSKVSKTAANFEKWYTNEIAVIKLEQSGSLGATVRIAARVDTSRLDTDNLLFYAYNGKKVTLMKNTNYKVDSKGYVYFDTKQGGYIIVTDRKLSK